MILCGEHNYFTNIDIRVELSRLTEDRKYKNEDEHLDLLNGG